MVSKIGHAVGVERLHNAQVSADCEQRASDQGCRAQRTGTMSNAFTL